MHTVVRHDAVALRGLPGELGGRRLANRQRLKERLVGL